MRLQALPTERSYLTHHSSGDAAGATPAQSKARYDAVVAAKPSTILALNHDVKQTTAHEVLPHAIAKLRAAGYKLVTLAECLGMKPYQSVGSPQVYDVWNSLSPPVN